MLPRVAACFLSCCAAAETAAAQEGPALASATCELAGGWAAAVDGPHARAELLDLVAYADVIVREHPGRAAPHAWRGVILASLAVHEEDETASARRASARIDAARAARDAPRLARAAVAETFDRGGWRGVPHRMWRRHVLKRAARRACDAFDEGAAPHVF